MNSTNQLPPLVRVGIFLGGWAFIAAAVVSGVVMTQFVLEARRSAAWPSTEGTIGRALVTGGIHGYYTDVQYAYRVEGRHYLETKAVKHHRREEAEEAIHGLTAGQKVRVYYDPNRPDRSVLRAGARFEDYWMLIVPPGMALFGALKLMLLLPKKKPALSHVDVLR